MASDAAGITVNPPPGPEPPEVDPRIGQLNAQELTYFSQAIRHLIDHRISGIEYAEQRRSQIALVGGAAVAAGIALLPLATVNTWLPLSYAYRAGSIASILVGIAIWGFYAKQTNVKYPFVEPSSTWKWFYHHALPDKNQFAKRPSGFFRSRTRNEEAAAYTQQFQQFADRQVPSLKDPQLDSTEDLKQLFLLHVNERYKNAQLTFLRRVLVWGLIAILIVSVLGAMLGVLVDSGRANSDTQVNGSVTVTAHWQPTGLVRNVDGDQQSQISLVLRVSNTGSTAMEERRVIGTVNGVAVPTSIERHVSQLPTVVLPHTSRTLYLLTWVPTSDEHQIGGFELQ